jgi:hypothetical protein
MTRLDAFNADPQPDALWGRYDVTSEKYTFNVPESGTLGLILVGIGVVLVTRKNIGRNLSHAS